MVEYKLLSQPTWSARANVLRVSYSGQGAIEHRRRLGAVEITDSKYGLRFLLEAGAREELGDFGRGLAQCSRGRKNRKSSHCPTRARFSLRQCAGEHARSIASARQVCGFASDRFDHCGACRAIICDRTQDIEAHHIA